MNHLRKWILRCVVTGKYETVTHKTHTLNLDYSSGLILTDTGEVYASVRDILRLREGTYGYRDAYRLSDPSIVKRLPARYGDKQRYCTNISVVVGDVVHYFGDIPTATYRFLPTEHHYTTPIILVNGGVIPFGLAIIAAHKAVEQRITSTVAEHTFEPVVGGVKVSYNGRSCIYDKTL